MASKVFISHSAKSAEHLGLRDQLVAELEASGVNVWVDAAQIEVGDEWLSRITEGLGECYAGIVLFSGDALASDFVKYEVSCLAQRKRMHSGFGLFALNLGDVDIDTIRAGFYGSIRFSDLQIGSFTDKRAEVVAALKAMQPPPLTPTRELEGILLKYFPTSLIETMRRIATEKGWETWEDLGNEAEVLHFVRTLVSLPLTEQIAVLTDLKEGLDTPDIRKVFDQLAPSWVDENAALELDKVRFRVDGKRGALLNGAELEFTCDAFLRRARPTSGWAMRFHKSIPKGRLAGKRLAVQIRDSLCEQLTVKIPENATPEIADAAVNRKVALMEQVGIRPVHVLQLSKGKLPVTGSIGLLHDLQERFPKVTFVAMTGTGAYPQLHQPLADNVTLVKPALRTEAEVTRHNEIYAKEWYDLGCEALHALTQRVAGE